MTLSFADSEFNSFMNNQTVYVYKKAFPGALTERLQRMYYVGVTSEDLIDDFYSFDKIPYADFLGTQDYELLSIPPDDFYSNANIPTQHINVSGQSVALPASSFEHLDLVNARKAWNITAGDPNIAIGVRDILINPNHPDLINKVIQHYGYVPTNPTGYWHGTMVAGSAAADTDNNVGVASIGYNTKLVTSHGNQPYQSNDPDFANAYPYPKALLYIVQNHPEVKVVTHSLVESCNYITANALVYQEIWEQYGVTVITAAGNGNWKNSCPDANGGSQGYMYPASYDHVISVSAVGHSNPYGYIDSNGVSWGWKDVHEFVIGNDYFTFTHNDKVDVVAPAYGVPASNLDDKYATGFGTSFAGPFVCGIAALMYSVNPNITPDQVKQILRDTAEESIYDIPENAPYIGLLGTGRVNAYAAVLQAKCLANPVQGLDLMMQNSENDFGAEPDMVTNPIWNSPDIWVRNQPDGFLYQEHQDLEYINDQTPVYVYVYVYVRITNNSCETSTGSEELRLHWAKGGLSQVWPTIWTGSSFNGLPTGDNVGTQNIPLLAPGESTILEFVWQPHNPDEYQANGFNKPWMFCFLARIVTSSDPMTTPEGSNAAANTKNNNNIAYKNTTVINLNLSPKVGSILAGNLGNDESVVSDIQFFTVDEEDNNLWEEAEVRVELDAVLWENWMDNGGQATEVEILDEENHIVQVRNNSRLRNIPFAADETGILTVGVNFLIDEVEQQENYELQVEQIHSGQQYSMGGFTYVFERDAEREEFDAEGQRERNNNITTLKATTINEPATYNWYNEDGELVHSGEQLTVTDPIAQEYKLEVIANNDGHKDYTTINSESPYSLESISPNPSSHQVQVNYNIQGASSAYLMLTSTQTAISNNYILNTTQDNISIDVSNYNTGTYVVTLVCNGQVIESKNLIIQ